MGLGHGFSWVVLNASAWRALPEGGLRGLLRYVATEEVGDDKLAADLAAAVEAANEDAAWREEALTMLTIEEDMRAQARFMMKESAKRAWQRVSPRDGPRVEPRVESREPTSSERSWSSL
ncbi:MAG: hypothetical protein HFJ68_10525 [Adlercreutzia caecimuris]|uniref:hypothetical protein n=1 Tax=Adlercreutzia caecimuris TaxID=671266 RepID=UPI00242F5BF8|nr:hypothetical protein [Adlercreutzia caecimuris]MCI9208946.1 hypothetical protein [Adlercreutzia caecimuris]